MEADEFLAHYGVKGMRWGKTSKPKSIAKQKQTNRKIGAYGGSALGLAAGLGGQQLVAAGLRATSSSLAGQRIVGGMFGVRGTMAVYTAAKIASIPELGAIAAVGGAQIGGILGVKKANQINKKLGR